MKNIVLSIVALVAFATTVSAQQTFTKNDIPGTYRMTKMSLGGATIFDANDEKAGEEGVVELLRKNKPDYTEKDSSDFVGAMALLQMVFKGTTYNFEAKGKGTTNFLGTPRKMKWKFDETAQTITTTTEKLKPKKGEKQSKEDKKPSVSTYKMRRSADGKLQLYMLDSEGEILMEKL